MLYSIVGKISAGKKEKEKKGICNCCNSSQMRKKNMKKGAGQHFFPIVFLNNDCANL